MRVVFAMVLYLSAAAALARAGQEADMSLWRNVAEACDKNGLSSRVWPDFWVEYVIAKHEGRLLTIEEACRRKVVPVSPGKIDVDMNEFRVMSFKLAKERCAAKGAEWHIPTRREFDAINRALNDPKASKDFKTARKVWTVDEIAKDEDDYRGMWKGELTPERAREIKASNKAHLEKRVEISVCALGWVCPHEPLYTYGWDSRIHFDEKGNPFRIENVPPAVGVCVRQAPSE